MTHIYLTHAHRKLITPGASPDAGTDGGNTQDGGRNSDGGEGEAVRNLKVECGCQERLSSPFLLPFSGRIYRSNVAAARERVTDAWGQLIWGISLIWSWS
jgi:hypothetical protein